MVSKPFQEAPMARPALSGSESTPLRLVRASEGPERHAPGRAPHWTPPAKYERRRIIGTGGLGSVMLARDLNLDRLVAIKVLLTDCEQFLTRLRAEARLLARLEHPAIVRVHDLDVHQRRLFLAMEYAPGGNLALARLAPVPLVRTLRGIVDALQHAHAHGIVHRDVKPENVLLLDSPGGAHRGRVPAVLADFGLAAGSGEGTSALRRPIVGTPLTMSPEQTAGEPVGPASDVFSLGVTFYRMLSGRWPFPGRTVLDVFDAICHQEPAPLSAGGKAGSERIPRRLEAAVLKAIAKDPVDRFASMAEFGRALDRYLLGRSLFHLPFKPFSRRRGRSGSSGSRIHPPRPPSFRPETEDPS
jgi:serine/threonine-protein kinase